MDSQERFYYNCVEIRKGTHGDGIRRLRSGDGEIKTHDVNALDALMVGDAKRRARVPEGVKRQIVASSRARFTRSLAPACRNLKGTKVRPDVHDTDPNEFRAERP